MLAAWPARENVKMVPVGQAANPQKPGALKQESDSDAFETRYFQERLYACPKIDTGHGVGTSAWSEGGRSQKYRMCLDVGGLGSP